MVTFNSILLPCKLTILMKESWWKKHSSIVWRTVENVGNADMVFKCYLIMDQGGRFTYIFKYTKGRIYANFERNSKLWKKRFTIKKTGVTFPTYLCKHSVHNFSHSVNMAATLHNFMEVFRKDKWLTFLCMYLKNYFYCSDNIILWQFQHCISRTIRFFLSKFWSWDQDSL